MPVSRQPTSNIRNGTDLRLFNHFPQAGPFCVLPRYGRYFGTLDLTDKEGILSAQIIGFLIPAALLLHGVAHLIALGALFTQSLGKSSASRLALRSWLLPSISEKLAATLAIPFWFVSAIGFLGASMSFWGFLVTGGVWRQLAVVSAIVSMVGIAAFSGIWPGSPSRGRSTLNTLLAMSMNVIVLAGLLVLRWLPEAALAR